MMVINMKNYHLTEELLFDLEACDDAVEFVKRNKLIDFPLERLNEIYGDYKGYVNWIKTRKNNGDLDNCKNKSEVKDKKLLFHYERKVYSDNQIDTKTFDSDGNLIRFRHSDSNGFWIEYEYDNKNRIVRQSDSTGYFKNIIYDDYNIIEINYSNGFVLNYEYDEFGNKIKMKDSTGYWEKRKYDDKHNVIELEDSTGYWEKRKYDDNNNVIRIETKNYWRESEYDMAGNQIGFKNSNGAVCKSHTTFYDNGQLKSFDAMIIPQF